MQILSAHSQDLPEIEDLILAIKDSLSDFPAQFNWDGPSINHEFHHSIGWTIRIQSKLAAFLFCRELPDAYEITVLATDVRFQKRGLQTELVKYLKVLAASHRKTIWLEVHDKNETAIRFYQNNGFFKSGMRPAYYRDGGSAILMNWSYHST